jgi:uncharacterized protein (TIGR02145 family)
MIFINRHERGRLLVLAAALCMIFCGAAFAQLPKVAVYVTSNTNPLTPSQKSFLTRTFYVPFTASGLYNIIDRSEDFAKQVDVERLKQRDPSVNEDEVKKVGFEHGAKYICIVVIDSAYGKWRISASMSSIVGAGIKLPVGMETVKGRLDDADFDWVAARIFGQMHKGTSGGASGAAAGGLSVSFTDGRDGKTYKTVKIGDQVWMAENLRYETGSFCYDGDTYNMCKKYGRLYNWSTAKTACPDGFHLPSSGEWTDLAIAAGGGSAGTALKAKSGWSRDFGTDAFGFSALPGGYGYYSNTGSRYYDASTNAYWWTATDNDRNEANARVMAYNSEYVSEKYTNKNYWYSVRCVRND